MDRNTDMPGKGGRGAIFICPGCGKQFARTIDGQSKCLECMEKDREKTSETDLEHKALYKELWDATDYVCPMPFDWSKIIERLAKEYAKLHPERPYYDNISCWKGYGIPTPLILGGWIASNEAKKERWVGAMVWAKENDLFWVIEQAEFEKYYG